MTKIKRTYHPGSEWVYYKIYTGPKTADTLLVSLIQPVAEKLLEDKHIEKWFFIRYQDPKFHLRVRFKVKNLEAIGPVINEFNLQATPFLEDNLIWKLQLDTYQREIERYGLYTMDASESVFFQDSEMIVTLLDLIDDSEEGEELRWLFSLKAIDAFLNDFKLSDDQKLYVIEQMKINFCHEFHMNRVLKKQLDKKFLFHKKKIEEFLEINEKDTHELAPLMVCIAKKTESTKRDISDIKSKLNPEELNSFLASNIHMIMNRLFRSKNRIYEMVIYYFIFKHYKAVSGRKKYNTLSIAQ